MPEWLLWTVIIVNLGAWLIFLMATLANFASGKGQSGAVSIYRSDEPDDQGDELGDRQKTITVWL